MAMLTSAALPPQHWFSDSSAHTNDYQHVLYNLKHNKPSTSSSVNMTTTTNHSSTKPMFGTSIFGHHNGPSSNGRGLISPRSPQLLYNGSTQSMVPENSLREPSPSPLPQLICSTPPPIQMLSDDASDEMSHITHLIKHLSITIQEMNQFLDAHQGPDSKRAGVTKKTTNCRNEMVSTLSYYQTYIQSNSPRLRSHTNSRSPRSPIPYNQEEDRLHQSLLSPSSQQSHSMYPTQSQRPAIDQGSEYCRYETVNQSFTPSASNGNKKGNFGCRPHCNGKTSSSSNSNAKQIALDVVGNVIGTPGPMIRDSSMHSQLTQMETPDMIASAFAQNANSQQSPATDQQEQHKSTLNAYARPYQTEGPYAQQPAPHAATSQSQQPSRSPHHHSNFQMTHSQAVGSHPAPPAPLHHQAVQQRVQQHVQALNVPSSQYVRSAQPQQTLSPPTQQFVDRSGSMQSQATAPHSQHQMVQQYNHHPRYPPASNQQRVSTQSTQQPQSSTATAGTAPNPVAQHTAQIAPRRLSHNDERSLPTTYRTTTTANGYTTTHTAPGFVRPPPKAMASQNRTLHMNGYGHSRAIATSSSTKVEDTCTGNREARTSPMTVEPVQEVSENHKQSEVAQIITVSPQKSNRTQRLLSREHDENIPINNSHSHGNRSYGQCGKASHDIPAGVDIDFEDVAPESLYNGSSVFDGVETCDVDPSHTLSQEDVRRPDDYSPHSDPVRDPPPHPPQREVLRQVVEHRGAQEQEQEQGESSSNPFCGDSPNTNSITTNTNSTKSTSPKRPIKLTKNNIHRKSNKKQPTPKSTKSVKTAPTPKSSSSMTNTKNNPKPKPKPKLKAKSNGPQSSQSHPQRGQAQQSNMASNTMTKPSSTKSNGSSKLNGTKSNKETSQQSQQRATPSTSPLKREVPCTNNSTHHSTATAPVPAAPGNNKSGGVPLWSAIAKTAKLKKALTTTLTKKTLCPAVSPEEKTPEGSITDSDYSQFNVNRKHSTNYWRNRTNNYQSSLSTSSYSSASSKDNHITPSPTPPESKRRNSKKGGHSSGGGGNSRSSGTPPKSVSSSSGNSANERCRVFVSNLPPNVTDEDIRAAFVHCGEIANTVWFPSRTDGKFYGSGLITFSRHSGSENALRLNQQNVLGRIIRVEYSSCQDPVKVKPPGCRTIYLNNVPRDAQESRIRQVFKHCGRIKRVRFHERDTKRTGGAFVEFEHTASCDKALALHGKIVDNHPLYVDYQRY